MSWTRGWITPCLIAVIGLAAGCGEAGTDGAEVVAYDELNGWIEDEEDVVIIDVRTPTDYAAGHLQNAINIDLTELMDQSGAVLDGGSALTSVVTDKSTRIVAYCFGWGNDEDFADIAVELGYTSVYRYEGGTDDWATHENYLVIEYASVINWHDAYYPFGDGENYLIDDLPVDWYTGDDPDHPGGHIPGAINIPVELWADADGDPVDGGTAFTGVVAETDAKVVVYCGNWSCGKSLMGVKAAAALGYTNVFRYQGGWEEWIEEGNELTPGEDP